MTEQKCQKCDGCGQVADTEDKEPWTSWTSLPMGSSTALRVGLVRPIKCPACEGRGVR